MCSASSVDLPGRRPSSISARCTQPRKVSGEIPSCCPTRVHAPRRPPSSSRAARTSRTARSFNSGGYFFNFGMLLILSGCQEPPTDPGRNTTRPLRAAGAVLGDLADLGMDAAWIGLPASAIGAPHPRYRVFILARRIIPHSASLGRGERRGEPANRQSASRHDRTQPSDHRPHPPRAERISANRRTRDPMDVDRAALRGDVPPGGGLSGRGVGVVDVGEPSCDGQ